MRFYKAFPWFWTSPLDQLPNFIDETPNEATCERLFHTKSTENTECRVECYGLTQMAQTFAETCGAKFCVFLCFLCANISHAKAQSFAKHLREVISREIHRRHRILLRRLPIFFNWLYSFFSCRENRFSCRENKFSCREKKKFHALVIKFPCLGNKITRVGNKITRVGNKIGRQTKVHASNADIMLVERRKIPYATLR